MSNAAVLDRETSIAPAAIPDRPELSGPHRYRLAVADYHRLGEAGVINEDSRVELIEGDLIAMPRIGSQHAAHLDCAVQKIFQRTGSQAIVRVQSPIQLDQRSEPEPDLALLRPRADFYAQSHPTPEDILLLIEVSDSTLDYDRDIKMPLYAKAGIPEVWLLDLVNRRLAIYRRPSPDGYREVLYPALDESIAPVLLSGLAIEVGQLLITAPPASPDS